MEGHSLFDWVSVLAPTLLSWPLVIAIVLVFFYKPVFALLEKFSGQKIQKAKIGPFEIEETEQAYGESLKLLMTSLISENELNHLRQLKENKESIPYESSPDLIVDLQRLNHLGFINSKLDLHELPDQGDLRRHLELTEKGEQYLALRHNLVASHSTEED